MPVRFHMQSFRMPRNRKRLKRPVQNLKLIYCYLQGYDEFGLGNSDEQTVSLMQLKLREKEKMYFLNYQNELTASFICLYTL